MISFDIPLFVYLTDAMPSLLRAVVGAGSNIAGLASVHGIAQAVTVATRAVTRALHICVGRGNREKIQFNSQHFLKRFSQSNFAFLLLLQIYITFT